MIEQEPFCGVRTHFYHDVSSYDMFRDRRVVESHFYNSVITQPVVRARIMKAIKQKVLVISQGPFLYSVRILSFSNSVHIPLCRHTRTTGASSTRSGRRSSSRRDLHPPHRPRSPRATWACPPRRRPPPAPRRTRDNRRSERRKNSLLCLQCVNSVTREIKR